MTPRLLLEKINLLLGNPPPADSRISYQREHFEWLGKANALIEAWNPREMIGFKMATDWVAANLNRSANLGKALATLHTAAASLEQALPELEGQVFGPGAVYDFFRALNELVASAQRTLLVIDPYMDAQVFDAYLSNCTQGVAIRLLASLYAPSIGAAAVAFRQQHSSNLEVRMTREIHDRLVIVDQSQCWVLGASIKDAADNKPTYLAPLPSELVAAKAALYEGVRANAQAI